MNPINVINFILLSAADSSRLTWFDKLVYGFRTWLENWFVRFSTNSWQIRVSYYLLWISISITIFLLFKLVCKIYLRRRSERKYDAFRKEHEKIIQSILEEEKLLTDVEIKDRLMLTKDDELSKNIEHYATLIADLKWKYDDKAFIPNMQLLCNILKVTSYYEEELITGNNILTVLQELITLPLPLEHEGVLACYINHYDSDVRNLARMCYIISTADAPYQYLQQVLDENKAQWNTMLLHKIFEWMNAQDREMPDFLVLAKQTTNEDSAAFLIQEIAKLGSEDEKEAIWQFLEHDSLVRRKAAFMALTELIQHSCVDATGLEDLVLKNYDKQTEDIKRLSLILLKTINSGRSLDRFEQTFYESSCIDTKVCAITCLLGYDGFDGISKVRDMLESITDDKATANSLQMKHLAADEKIINQVVGMYIINNNKLGL